MLLILNLWIKLWVNYGFKLWSLTSAEHVGLKAKNKGRFLDWLGWIRLFFFSRCDELIYLLE